MRYTTIATQQCKVELQLQKIIGGRNWQYRVQVKIGGQWYELGKHGGSALDLDRMMERFAEYGPTSSLIDCLVCGGKQCLSIRPASRDIETSYHCNSGCDWKTVRENLMAVGR